MAAFNYLHAAGGQGHPDRRGCPALRRERSGGAGRLQPRGHALQGTAGAIDMLPSIADAVGDRLEVYFDGGVRKGADVLKALALGARATFVGRPIFWGLSVAGENGVRQCLEILRNELSVAMGLCGVTDVKQVDRSVAQDPAATTASVVGDLERLARLLEQGYLTREEFETQKARLLG